MEVRRKRKDLTAMGLRENFLLKTQSRIIRLFYFFVLGSQFGSNSMSNSVYIFLPCICTGTHFSITFYLVLRVTVLRAFVLAHSLVVLF